MLFTLLDRVRSRIQRHKAWKASNKVPQSHPHMQRHSQDSNDSDFTHLSIDTTSSLSTITSVESLHTPLTGSDLLRTNDQPSPQQSLEIQALIQLKAQRLLEMERRKQDLDRQREILDRQRQLLDEEVGDMADEIDQYRRAVGCGMRNMPPELLSEIFQHYVAESSCSSSIGSATTLTHVCHAWRRCALSSPALWTSLHAPYITKHTVGNVLRRLDQAKAVTGLPLKLAFNLRRSSTDEFEQPFSDLMFASVAQIHRWESFTLESQDDSLASEAFPAISESMTASRLESLRLVGTPVSWAISLLHASPSLRNLQLKLSTDSTRVLSTLSLPHLESAEIDIPVITPNALLAFLKDAAPSLKVCKIRVAAIVDQDDEPMDMVEHSSLEIFELRVSRGASGDSIAQILETLSLPSAHEVLLEIGHLPTDTITHDNVLPDDHEFDLDLSWPHDSFLGFLERASSSVTSLCVGFNPTPVDAPEISLMGGMGAELEEDQVRAYLDLDNVGKSLVTLHVRRDKPVWPELLEYLTLPSTSSSSVSRHTSISAPLRSAKSRSNLHLHSGSPNSLRLPKLRNIALDIDPIFQVLPMRKFVNSRWYNDETIEHSFSCLQSFIVTLCFPDIPNLELESVAVRAVFERISRARFDVSFRKRTYAMMPMDVPRLPIRDELVI